MSQFDTASLERHRALKGKWETRSRFPLKTREDLSIAYTPGVAAVCRAVAENHEEAYPLTMKGNSVAIVSDGTAVLGLGDIGPEAALPVMEGKAILFKEFADIDGVPLVLNVDSEQELIDCVRRIAPTFGGINLEDIAAPRCFAVEEALQDIGIPVFHDDQHGTAIVLLAGLLNACKVTGKDPESLRVVIVGAGAAGTAIAKLLRCIGHYPDRCVPVKDVLMCDSKGILSRNRTDLNSYKRETLSFVNRENRQGTLHDALEGADVFIGVSRGNLLNADDIRSMASDPIIFAMANPEPEIMPNLAHDAGAAVVGTGRSDFPNQINNVLVFPGIFRGALDVRAARITDEMKIAAALALADTIPEPAADAVLPDPLDKSVAPKIAQAVREAADN